MKKKAVIIGAGPAGITVGCELLKNSDEYDVVILEQSDSIGGISRTVNHEGNRMDMGGHRFFSKDERVNRWWEEILKMQGSPSSDDIATSRDIHCSEGGPDPEQQDEVMLLRRRVSRIYYNKKFFDYPVKMNLNTICAMGPVTTIQAGFSFLWACIHKLPETSLENFYINRFGRKLYSMFFESYTHKLWGRHPSEISADWGAQRVKGLSVAAVLKDCFGRLLHIKNSNVETSLIEEFKYPKYGPGQLWECASSRFRTMGGRIITDCRVDRIIVKNGSVHGIECVCGGEKKTFCADVIFSSMPVKNLIRGMNNVPADVRSISEGLPYRNFVTIGVLVDRINLKNKTNYATVGDIVPDCWIYVQEPSVTMGRIQIFNNWSPYLVKNPKSTVWMGLEYFCGDDKEWNRSDEEWSSLAVNELKQMNIIDNDTKIITTHCERVEKAYPAYFDTYDRIDRVIGWLDDIDGLYCIGRNGQHRYNNMDHSMLTAMEAVSNLLTNDSDNSNIWNVNTEQSYHEDKATA